MNRTRIIVLEAVCFGICLSVAGPPAPHAVSCPGTNPKGAQIKVCITNPTGSQISGVVLHGNIAGNSPNNITCTGASGIYNDTVTVTAINGNSQCFTEPTSGGLETGYWAHKISAASGQIQYQKGAITVGSPLATVNFTYMPNVVTVNQGDDNSNSGTCPTNCTLRHAIETANGVSGTQPVLIQFGSSLTYPLTITMRSSTLQFTRGNVTIDGTDSKGNPWIVGDPNAAAAGTQDPFPVTVDLNQYSSFSMQSDNNTVKGIYVTNTIIQDEQFNTLFKEIIVPPTPHVGTMLIADKIDGETTACGGGGGVCNLGADLISAPLGDGHHTTVTLQNVEAMGADNDALDLKGSANATVLGSWLHNNAQANVGMSNSIATVTNSTIERAGLREGDDAQLGGTGTGITMSGDQSSVYTNGNIIRNNTSNGLFAKDVGNVTVNGDYVCGNGIYQGSTTADGILTSSGTNGPPSLNGGGPTGTAGLGATYNTGHGVTATVGSFTAANLSGDSVFTANGLCGLNPVGGTGSARGDQWRGSGPPFSDECSPLYTDVTGSQSGPNENMAFSSTPIFPTNVIRQGQTLRIQGSGFNGIDGNPLSTAANCRLGANNTGSLGQTKSCCNTNAKANTCSATHIPNVANCVELMGTSGTWEAASVGSVTPASIVTQIPDSTFGCVGTLGEEMSVSKYHSDGTKALIVTAFCTNSSPPY